MCLTERDIILVSLWLKISTETVLSWLRSGLSQSLFRPQSSKSFVIVSVCCPLIDTDKMDDMETETCTWSGLFDDNERKSLESGLFLADITCCGQTRHRLLSIIVGLWINLSLLLTKLRLHRSYRNMANFTIAACIRRTVPWLHIVPFLKMTASSNDVDSIYCKFYALLDTFLAVFEVECLTHVCIERYVIAKYITNGWPIQKNHYTLFQCLCFVFASLYSFPALFGIGGFGLDFTCSSCTFDMILSGSWERYMVVTIYILRSVKPALFMFMMLMWARTLERKLVCSNETQKQSKLTKIVIAITLVNIVCWTPIAVITGVVVFSQLLYSHPVAMTSAFYIKWALWIQCIAPVITVAVLFLNDDHIRDNMLHLRTRVHDQINDKKDKKG